MDNYHEKNYLSNIEAISTSASKCCMDFTGMNNVAVEVAELSGFLEISSVQAILFSCIAELSFQKTVTLDLLAKHMKCGVFKLIALLGEFDILESKGYIQKSYRNRGRKHSYNDIGFTVTHYVIEAIRKSDISMLTESMKYDLPGFLKEVSSLVEDRQQNSVSTSQVLSEVQFLINSNLELPFVAYVDSNLKELISKCTVFAFGYQRLKGISSICIEGYADSLFDDLSAQLDFSQMVCSGCHELVTKNFLRLVTSEFDGDKMGTITPQVLKMLYKDYPTLLVIDTKIEGLIKAWDITSKNLYFNNNILDQLNNVEDALKPEIFGIYREELQKNNLTKGITCIFSGAPGTGKTEAVYQIARRTGRNLMMVDLSQTKSKWFGESEKQVKKLFDDYQILLKNSDPEPILFINEADGLFTRRIEISDSQSHSADVSINTMQNILLQALENFEGIMIATTNLTGNIDRAFERRFTFRIDFPKPDSTVRMKIWKSKLNELSEEEATELGKRFDMTGGEIDVQIRQVILRKVLDRKTNIFEAVVDCCSKDKGFVSKRKIGY